jgi:uncharacterized protein
MVLMTSSMPSKYVLAGGSGFLGRTLAKWFADRSGDVVLLSRQPQDRLPGIREIAWDGRTLGPWKGELEGAVALINLAGRSVDCRYHARNRRLMMDSRVESTRILGEAIRTCQSPPRVWLNSSTATIYKHSFDQPMDEATGIIGATPEAKDAFSIDVARAWEQAFNEASTPATRKIALRTAMVLSAEPGTVFRVLRRLTRWGLGGAMGNGRQYMSWIHEVDFCRAVEWLIARDEIAGVVNVAAPHPLPNREVMRLIRKTCGAPFGLPASRLMLEIGAFFLRTETELVIKSRRVVPRRLLESGFEFTHAQLAGALQDLQRRIHQD